MGAEYYSDLFQSRRGEYAPYAGLLAFGLTAGAVAIFAPEWYARAWDWLRGYTRGFMSGTARTMRETAQSMESGSSTIPQTPFGTSAGDTGPGPWPSGRSGVTG
jgi:hypothetical protein